LFSTHREPTGSRKGEKVKTFITGATGFIGTHLVERMAQTEHEVVCLSERRAMFPG
jgi:nucleoside-diphosphate-sugar epimerase